MCPSKNPPDRPRRRGFPLRIAAPALVVPLLVGLGCSGADGPAGSQTPPPVAVRDSAGVLIVESHWPDREWQIASVPELRLGTVQGEAPYQFHRVQFAARLDDGRVVVLDGTRLEIRFFGPDGRHHETLGRQGGGPGEFGNFSSQFLGSGDTLWVLDRANRRITVVAPEPAIARERSVEGLEGFTYGVRLLGTLGEDRVLLASRSPSLPEPGPGPVTPGYRFLRDTLSVMAVPLSGSAPDTVVSLPGYQTLHHVQTEGLPPGTLFQIGGAQLPFAHDAHAGALSGAVVMGTTERPELRVVDAGGRLVRTLRRVDRDPVPVSTLQQRYLQHVERDARERGIGDVAAAIRTQRERFDLVPEGQVVPWFDRVMVDGERRVWVRDLRMPWEPSGPRSWTVYAEDGHPLAKVETPAALDLMHIGSRHLTGVERDELGVEYVVVYRIEGA